MPCAFAMPQMVARSATSIVGLAGVSKKKTLVLGRIAASHAALSVASTVVVSIPNLGSSVSVSQRQEPNSALPATTWSPRSEEHTSELQSLMRISYAVFCLKKKKTTRKNKYDTVLMSINDNATLNQAS